MTTSLFLIESQVTDAEFDAHRITFRRFVEDPSIVDQPNLVIKYGSRYVPLDSESGSDSRLMRWSSSYLTWQNASPVLAALAVYRRSLLPPVTSSPPAQKSEGASSVTAVTKPSKGYAWSRWWRRGESAGIPLDKDTSPVPAQVASSMQPADSHQDAKIRIDVSIVRLDVQVSCLTLSIP